MTYSIGFRQPGRGELARELLQRLAEDAEDAAGTAVYRDPGQAAVYSPGGIPPEMMAFARDALQAVLNDPVELQCLLGEYLSEPKASVWFDSVAARSASIAACGVTLDRRTRMMFDDLHIYINGESYRASGRDAALMHRLADQRRLGASEVARASQGARQLMNNWLEAGWLHDDR
jgi:50S ribosomal protein L16 3-hydroxylase